MGAIPKTIFIVDDSSFSRKIIHKHIAEKRPDWIISEISSGDEAIKLVNSETPDYITMDINMPGVLGTDAAEKILAKHPAIRIVVFSANIQESMRSRAVEIGARFVAKPVTEKSILQAISYFSDGK